MIEIVWYKNPEDVIGIMWGVSEFVDIQEICGLDMDGNYLKISVNEFLARVQKYGVWGFAHKETMTIHAWKKGDAEMENVLKVLGHEIGHLMGEQLEDEEAEENRADGYGTAASLAWRFATGVNHG